jgi:hypothetical protein
MNRESITNPFWIIFFLLAIPVALTYCAWHYKKWGGADFFEEQEWHDPKAVYDC